MKKYKVMWEEQRYVIVEAESANEAVDRVWADEGDFKVEDGEITTSLQAMELN
jgi:hypothetical protein